MFINTIHAQLRSLPVDRHHVLLAAGLLLRLTEQVDTTEDPLAASSRSLLERLGSENDWLSLSGEASVLTTALNGEIYAGRPTTEETGVHNVTLRAFRVGSYHLFAAIVDIARGTPVTGRVFTLVASCYANGMIAGRSSPEPVYEDIQRAMLGHGRLDR